VFKKSVEQEHNNIWTHGCYWEVILKVMIPTASF